MPIDPSERMVKRIKDRLLIWRFALALVLALIGLIAATGESLRRQEHGLPLTDVSESPLSPQRFDADERYYGSGVAGWPTP